MKTKENLERKLTIEEIKRQHKRQQSNHMFEVISYILEFSLLLGCLFGLLMLLVEIYT
ncbi:MAG: hypothetical protein JJT76_16130 [Clostridiaceae bacterium]|nr:hypothetical protein [Clostridiaceae bacterium]